MTVVGIDLGTTNSVIAFYEGGQVNIIPNSEGYRTTPSIVAFTIDNKIIVGEQAKRQILTNSNNTVTSVKRKIGTNFTYTINDKAYSSEDISSKILKKLKNDAENYLGYQVSDAVITVPAYFDDSQRNSTKNAGILAGFNVLRIINEPTAAAFAYGFDKKNTQQKQIIVYDLGGGTFDVSLLYIENGLIEVKATSGINDLGGDDWDVVLAHYIQNQIENKFNIKLDLSSEQRQRLLQTAERAKIELSSTESVTINLPYFTSINDTVLHFEDTITRDIFESLTYTLLDKTSKPIYQVLSDSKLSFSDIDELILIGGSTRMPAVSRYLEKLTGGKHLNRSVNPDEAVAFGAALQGGVLDGKINDVLLLDVTPLSLGIKTKGGIMHKLIDRNSTIPISKTEIFSTAYDDQRVVKVEIYQGEREFVKDNLFLASFELNDIPIAPAGTPEINVTFSIDADGIVSVSAEDLLTKKENNITLKNAFEVSSEFVDDHIKISENKKDEDMLNKYDMYINEQINNIKSTAEYYINSNYLDNNPDLKDKLKEIYNTFLASNNTELTKVASKLRNLLHEISLIKDNDSNK
jgi:molecular chaperone DnaK